MKQEGRRYTRKETRIKFMLHMKQQKADEEEIFTIAEHDFQLASKSRTASST